MLFWPMYTHMTTYCYQVKILIAYHYNVTILFWPMCTHTISHPQVMTLIAYHYQAPMLFWPMCPHTISHPRVIDSDCLPLQCHNIVLTHVSSYYLPPSGDDSDCLPLQCHNIVLTHVYSYYLPPSGDDWLPTITKPQFCFDPCVPITISHPQVKTLIASHFTTSFSPAVTFVQHDLTWLALHTDSWHYQRVFHTNYFISISIIRQPPL